MSLSRALICAVAVAVAPLHAAAQEQAQVASLRGISGVVIVIADLPPGLASAIDTAALRRRVESTLQGYGIEPLSALHSGPSLRLRVTGRHSAGAHMWALSESVEVTQFATLERPPHEQLATATWEGDGATAMVGDAGIRDEVKKLTDSVLYQFVNAWMFANPPC